jgi:4-hydroxy-tetrahydrodipicolinate synthase
MLWQYRILELFDAMLIPFEFPDGFRAAAGLRGFRMGRGRQPMSPAQQADRGPLESVLQCILSDFGMVAPPASGCAPRTGGMAQDKIAQVVYQVMKVLADRGVV